MKRIIVFLFSCFVFSLAAQAQTPAPPSQNFIISLSAASYSGTNGSQPVSIASAGFQLTKNVSLAYEQLGNPMDSTAAKTYSGVANYSREVASLLPASIKSKLVMDTTNYIATFQFGAGRQSLATATPGVRVSHIVGNFGAYLGRQVAPHAQLGGGIKLIVGARLEVIKVPVGNLNFTF